GACREVPDVQARDEEGREQAVPVLQRALPARGSRAVARRGVQDPRRDGDQHGRRGQLTRAPLASAMTHEHRVASHLGVAASDYDAEIRRYFPRYDEMVATVVGLVRGRDVVVDLGAGTGALGGAIAEALPARVVMIDIDPAMLEVAAARTA